MRLKFLPLTIAALIVTGVVYADDRDATPPERARVMDALEALGCSSVDDIDVNANGSFDVDDAVCDDGKKYDFVLDQELKVISKREDGD